MNRRSPPLKRPEPSVARFRLWWLVAPGSLRADVVLLLLFAAFFTLGQLQRFQSGQLVMYAFDVVIVCWLSLHWRWVVTTARANLHWLRLHPLALLTVAWVVASCAAGVYLSASARGLLVLIRLVTYTLFAFSVGTFFQTNRWLARVLLSWLGMSVVLLGILQFAIIPDTRFLFSLGWDEHYYRLIGTLFDPNFTGMLIVLTQLYLLSILRHHSRQLLIIVLSSSALCSMALAVTYSRASYTVWVLLLLLALISSQILPLAHVFKRILFIVVLGVVFGVTFLLAPKPGGEGVNLYRTRSIQTRVDGTTAQFSSRTDLSLWLGSGLFVPTQPGPVVVPTTPTTYPANTDLPNRSQLPDNLLALLLSGTGIIGTLLIIASAISGLRWLRTQEVALMAAVGLTLLHSQANNTVFQPFVFLFLMLAVASPLLKAKVLPKHSPTYRRSATRKTNRLPH